MLKNNKKSVINHGGPRPGSGRKKMLENAGQWKAYLDQETHEFMIRLGDGSFSAGIRKARALLESKQ